MPAGFPQNNTTFMGQLLGGLGPSINGGNPGLNQRSLDQFLNPSAAGGPLLNGLVGTGNDPLTQFQTSFQALSGGNGAPLNNLQGIPSNLLQGGLPTRADILDKTFNFDRRNVINVSGLNTLESELTPTVLRKIIGKQLFSEEVAGMSDAELQALAKKAKDNKTYQREGILNELFSKVMDKLQGSPEYEKMKEFAAGHTSTELLKMGVNEKLSPQTKVLLVMAANRQRSKHTMWNMVFAEVKKHIGEEDPYISKMQKDNDELVQRINRGGDDETADA